jgi:hypothetical protein
MARCVNVHTYSVVGPASMACMACSYIPAMIATGLILGIIGAYYTFFVFGILLDRVGGGALMFWWAFLGGGVVFALLTTSYMRAVFTCPGYADQRVWGSKPPYVSASQAQAGVSVRQPFVTKLTSSGQLRYCVRCMLYKPDDSHHCSDCDRCVLKMDHHCPWINNCVGRYNEKFFVLFIGYVPVCAAHIVGTIWAFYDTHGGFTFRSGHVSSIITALAAGIFGFVLGLFTLFHLYLIAISESTLDRKFRTSQPNASSTPLLKKVFTCNLPKRRILRARFSAVMGEDWRLWFLPIASPLLLDADSSSEQGTLLV